MSDRDDDNNETNDGDQTSANWSQNETLFSDFEEESDYEDSDRDSDFAAIYTEVDEDEPEELDSHSLDAAWELKEEASRAFDDDPWSEPENESTESDPWDKEPNPSSAFDDEPSTIDHDLPPLAAPPIFRDLELEEEWDDMDEDQDYEDEDYEEEDRELNISLGMIIVAVLALVLLGAGGYGVIEQRAAMQEEIRQLQASLATSAAPKDVAASRLAAAQASERNVELQEQFTELLRENSNLQAIVSGLEKQLAAQQEALKKTAATPEPKPVPPAPAVNSSAVASGWFVNFSSYSQRSTADGWLKKLQPSSGKVIVATGQIGGKTVYRVRVVELPDRSTAEFIARTLEKEYGLPKLWVGKSR